MKLGALVLGLVIGAVGCANSATVTEKAPVTQDLSAYRTATVAVSVAPGIDNPDAFKSALGLALDSRLKDKKLFEVVADGGDLTLKVLITKLDKPSSLAGVPMGESDASASVELVDVKASKSLGAFDIVAGSKKTTSTSLNGVDTSTGEDPRKRSINNAADQIAAYIEKHRGAAK